MAARVSSIDAGQTLKLYRTRSGLSQMALAVQIGVTLPAVSGWERNLYRPRRPTAQRLDDELNGGGAILAAFGYAPLPSSNDGGGPADADDRIRRLETIVSQLTARLDEVQGSLSKVSRDLGVGPDPASR